MADVSFTVQPQFNIPLLTFSFNDPMSISVLNFYYTGISLYIINGKSKEYALSN